MSKINEKLIDYEPFDSWSENVATEKLNQLYKSVIVLSENAISWYQEYQKTKGQWSKVIRLTSIILLIASTLMPYFSSIKSNTDLLYIGYIFAGVAGGLLLLDKHYGFSNSWVRFVLTGLDLENLHYSFIKKWQILRLNNSPLTPVNFIVLVEALIIFQEQVNGIVKAETTTWAQEFQQNYKELMANVKSQSEKLKADIEKSKQEDLKKSTQDNPMNVPIEIIREAIDRKGKEWDHLYGPLESISTGYKNINNNKTPIACIHFDVATKPAIQNLDRIKVIPSFIWYFGVDGKAYQIPTDVNEVGVISPDTYDTNQPMSVGKEVNPKMLGLSCSRVGSMAAGTIGLRVSKIGDPDTTYLLSCYHVLCAPEKEQGKVRVMSANDLLQNGTIISPGLIDGNNDNADGTVALADVVEGMLADNMDIAIAKLNKPLNGVVYRTSIVPSAEHLLPIDGDHEKASYVLKIVGRTSGKQTGEVVSSHCSANVNYPGIGIVSLNGVIKTTKMSKKGDSGAAVYDDAKNLIGILFASNETNSYILPIIKVLSKLNLQII